MGAAEKGLDWTGMVGVLSAADSPAVLGVTAIEERSELRPGVNTAPALRGAKARVDLSLPFPPQMLGFGWCCRSWLVRHGPCHAACQTQASILPTKPNDCRSRRGQERKKRLGHAVTGRHHATLTLFDRKKKIKPANGRVVAVYLDSRDTAAGRPRTEQNCQRKLSRRGPSGGGGERMVEDTR